MKTETPEARLEAANELIKVIASCGRQFFRDGETIAHLERDQRGRIWIHDEYTGDRICTHYKGYWKGFNHGGTMRTLIENLRDYITQGKPVPASTFGPWPEWICHGDLWGYGEDMQIVRDKAVEFGIILKPCTDYYVVSLDHTYRRDKWITLWRPNDAGYCYELLTAGKYSEERIRSHLNYYNSGKNIAVPCGVIDAIATPEAGIVPEGPILAIKNNATNWKKILKAVIEKPRTEPRPEYRGAPKYGHA